MTSLVPLSVLSASAPIIAATTPRPISFSLSPSPKVFDFNGHCPNEPDCLGGGFGGVLVFDCCEDVELDDDDELELFGVLPLPLLLLDSAFGFSN